MKPWSQQEVDAHLAKMAESSMANITVASKKNKYNAQRVTVDNINFASKREAARYVELKLMQQAGLITGLQVHPAYTIRHHETDICRVELDFWYSGPGENGLVRPHLEDVKSAPTDTPLSKLKRKLVEAFYGIKVTLVK